MSELKLSIVTPESKVLEVSCQQVNLPGSEGVLGVLYGHMNLISSLKPGVIEYFNAGDVKPSCIAISDGFVEISQSECIVLVEHSALSETFAIEHVNAKIAELTSKLLNTELAETAMERLKTDLEYYNAVKSIM